MTQKKKEMPPRVCHSQGGSCEDFKLNYIIKSVSQQGDSSNLISKAYDRNVCVPKWMMQKVFRLVLSLNDNEEIRRGTFCELLRTVPRQNVADSLYRLEFEAAILLKEDLLQRPDIAPLVPGDFLDALKVSPNGSNLSRVERASIVIVQSDADECLVGADYNAFIELLPTKWVALNWLLTEAPYER